MLLAGDDNCTVPGWLVRSIAVATEPAFGCANAETAAAAPTAHE